MVGRHIPTLIIQTPPNLIWTTQNTNQTPPIRDKSPQSPKKSQYLSTYRHFFSQFIQLVPKTTPIPTTPFPQKLKISHKPRKHSPVKASPWTQTLPPFYCHCLIGTLKNLMTIMGPTLQIYLLINTNNIQLWIKIN